MAAKLNNDLFGGADADVGVPVDGRDEPREAEAEEDVDAVGAGDVTW